MPEIISSYSLQELAQAVAQELLPQLRTSIRMEPEQEEKLIDIKAAAKLFEPAVSTRTISNWLSEGYLSSYRVGGRIFFKKSEVIESAKKIKRYSKNQSDL